MVGKGRDRWPIPDARAEACPCPPMSGICAENGRSLVVISVLLGTAARSLVVDMKVRKDLSVVDALFLTLM